MKGFVPGQLFELVVVMISLIGSYFILRRDFKRYAILYIISSAVGIFLCLIFVRLGFYSFPNKLFMNAPIPMVAMFTNLPFIVLVGVMFSPVKWGWKIPFYWGLVHIIMFFETLVLYKPFQIIKYDRYWDFWDSYTLWWIFLLIFDWIGGKIVPTRSRSPLQSKSFRYGRWAWILLHFILISTIFLGGVYTGWKIKP